ncbi:MAG: nuclear transport factor 2 family protein [Gemmatimonadota bacterium]
MTRRSAVLLFILITAIRPLAAWGQDLPGGRSVDVDLQRAQFNALMIKTVREFNTAWQNAWPVVSNGNRLADHYNAEATLLQPGGALISGQPAIRAFTDSLRTQVRDATLALMDYDASEGIAYYYGSFQMSPRQPTDLDITGQHFTVLKRESKGFRIRAQLLMANEGTSALPRFPAAHPGGPLTVTAMSNKGTVDRYRSANALIHALHQAWSRSDSTALLSLFHGDALIQLPGQQAGNRGTQARRDLTGYIARSGELHMVTLDFEGAGRMSIVIGRYYLEVTGGTSVDGYFGLVMTGYGDDWRIRSLVFS